MATTKKNADQEAHTVLAAGAVLTQGSGDQLRCAVVHRPRYDDWSLPKGKVDPGESLPVTAVRELKEETGYSAVLGRRLGVTAYPLKPNTRKEVTYWSATVSSGSFQKNSEVDELRWLPIKEASELVTYPLDRKILKRYAKLTTPQSHVLLVRHARAGDRSEWTGDDNVRPLDKKGRVQAELLAPMLRAFGATDLFAAPRTRCEQTLAPIANELGTSIQIEDAVSDESYMEHPKAAVRRLKALADSPGIPVVCSQGTAIPGMLSDLAAKSDLKIDDASSKKAGLWVLGFTGAKLVSADYYPSPLPVR